MLRGYSTIPDWFSSENQGAGVALTSLSGAVFGEYAWNIDGKNRAAHSATPQVEERRLPQFLATRGTWSGRRLARRSNVSTKRGFG